MPPPKHRGFSEAAVLPASGGRNANVGVVSAEDADDLTKYGLLPMDGSVGPPKIVGLGGTHLSNYLPADELNKLSRRPHEGVEAAGSVTPSPLGSDNIGHVMLAGMGWSAGKGLGPGGAGIVEPVAGGVMSQPGRHPGIGSETAKSIEDDDVTSFRQRMSKASAYRNAVMNSGPQNNFMPGTVPPPRER